MLLGCPCDVVLESRVQFATCSPAFKICCIFALLDFRPFRVTKTVFKTSWAHEHGNRVLDIHR